MDQPTRVQENGRSFMMISPQHSIWMSDVFFGATLALFSVLLYANTFSGGYVWDDRAAIITNKDVLQERPLMDLFVHDFWGQDITNDLSHKSYRPITVLSFRINHMLHGLHAEGYHVVNVVIYTVTVLMAFKLGLAFMSNRSARVAAMLFCFHPIHVEAVASLVGRADSLCATFFIGAILLYIPCVTNAQDGGFGDGNNTSTVSAAAKKKSCDDDRDRPGSKPVYFVLALFAAVAASFSKEIGVTVFSIFPCLEVCVKIKQHRNRNAAYSAGKEGRRSLRRGYSLCIKGVSSVFLELSEPLLRTAITAAVLIIMMHLRVLVNGDTKIYEWTKLENHIYQLPTFKERFLSFAQSHFWYLFKLCFPRYLCFDYGFACIPTIHEIGDVRNLLPVGAYGAVLAATSYAILHVHVPLIFGVVLFVVPLLPALNIFLPVGTVLAERLLFLPSLGFCFVVSQIITEEMADVWASQQQSSSSSSSSSSSLLSSPPTVKKAMPPDTGQVMSSTTATPSKSALSQVRRGQTPLYVLITCICALFAVRVVTRNSDWNSELQIYESALTVCPLSAKALTNYAVLSMRDNTIHKSLIAALSGTDIYKEQAPAYLNTGVVMQRLGYHARSTWYYEQALVRRGLHAGKTYGYLGGVLYDWSMRNPLIESSVSDTQRPPNGNTVLRKMAMNAFGAALHHNFHPPLLYHSCGSLAIDMGDNQYAVECFEMALNNTRIARAAASDVPREDLVDEVLTYNQLGHAYNQLGQNQKAIEAFREGLKYATKETRMPDYASVLVNLGSVYRQTGQQVEARKCLLDGIQSFDAKAEAPPPALLNNLGLVEQDLGHLDDAVRYLRQAVEVHRRIRENEETLTFFMRSASGNGDDDSIEETLVSNLERAVKMKEEQR
jgi:tetratricopeptide (TPR) repeat protein